MNKRINYLDYVRCLACFLVILIHSPLPSSIGGTNIAISICNYIASPCIGLFFMVSGVLLFPVKEPLVVFLKKRSKRILFPLLFWSVFYNIVKVYMGELSVSELPEALFTMFYAPSGHGILWFVYELIALYLFAPILSKWLDVATKQDLHYYLFLWLLTLLLPYLQIETLILGNFMGYMGYMVLGYYLAKYPLSLSWFSIMGILVVVSGVLPMLYYLDIFSGVENSELYGSLTINVAFIAVVYFTFFQRYNFRPNKIITQFSIMSFGIYLVHIFIMRRIVWIFVSKWEMPQIIEILLVAVTTLVLSYIVVKIISLLRWSKYIIG